MAARDAEENCVTIDVDCQLEESFRAFDLMRKERKLCNVTLVAKNVEIPAHKSVLASCSPFFYSMFTGGECTNKGRIELDVNPQIMMQIVNYMYTSKLIVSEENITDVLKIAKMLLLHNVQHECCKVLERIMDPSNCLGMKVVASTYGGSDLLANVTSYIDDNFTDVVVSEEFLNLTNDRLSELLSRDSLRLPSEEKVYECVVRWINHDPKARRRYLRSLMGCVRLSYVSKSYLKQHIVNDPFLRGDAYCKDMIINALIEDVVLTTKPRRYQQIVKTLLAVGGIHNKTLEFYDLEQRNWCKLSVMPQSVWLAGVVAVADKVYVVGGRRKNIASSAISVYDIATDDWQDIGNMSKERRRFGAAVLDNCIYAIGGRTDYVNSLNCAEKFNLETRKWSPIAPMSTRRENLGVGVVNSNIYAVGGDDDEQTLKSVERYDPLTDTWTTLSDMNEHRMGLGVCALNGKVYAIGGAVGTRCLRTVEVYDPSAGSWAEVAQLKVARIFPTVAVLNDRIYAVGGETSPDNQQLSSVEVYDKEIDTWTLLPEAMNVARLWHGLVVVDRRINHIYPTPNSTN